MTSYRRIIGVLLYMAAMTRPDLSHAVNYMAKLSNYPSPTLFKMLDRMISYAFHTAEYGIKYDGRSNLAIGCYTDSDFAQDVNTRKSMNGFLVETYGSPTYWKSKPTALICTISGC